LVAETPRSRDRYVDFLRALSIAVVVFGHWLMAIVYFKGGEFAGASVLEVVPWAWAATWLLQVMPLFFFVGGFSNFTSWRANERRGGSYFNFVTGRIERLMRPTAVFIGAWLAVAAVIEFAAPTVAESLRPGMAIIAKPLWFIAVYLGVVALAPAMLHLHRAYGMRVPVVMALCAAAVDVMRIALDLPLIGYLNFGFVWLIAHQLGFLYADGTFAAWSRRRLAAATVAGFGALALLTALGPYSASMVGAADGRVSNNDPPTICLVALSVGLIGAALLARENIARKLQGRRLWGAVSATNSVIMTVFLWHLTALLLAVVTLYPLGFPQPVGGTAVWWLTRPVWMVLVARCVVPFLVVFARFERPCLRPARGARKGSFVRATAGVAAATAGIAGFATDGFAGMFEAAGPISNAALLGTGVILLRLWGGTLLPACRKKLGLQ